MSTSGIKKAILAAGSQTALAAQLGISQQAVHKWIVVGYAPLLRAMQICRLYNIPLKELVNPLFKNCT